jgi:fatty acid desaturase
MTALFHGDVTIYIMAALSTKEVIRIIRGRLKGTLLKKEPTRLLWLAFYLPLVVACYWAAHFASYRLGWHPLTLLPLSLIVGLSFGGMAFVAHEALHGALVKSKSLSQLIGFLGFLPFCVGPHLWMAWHNRVHHGNTNVAGRDPDKYPNLAEYKRSTAARWSVDLAAPRMGKWRGLITLLVGFTFQSSQVLFSAKKQRILEGRMVSIALFEAVLGYLIWASVALLLGPELMLMLYVLPLVIGNTIVMSHIVTNHSLLPESDANDPLETSMTVTVPRWFSFYTLDFGYHVEHHMFPTMSHRHGRIVAGMLRELAPERYQARPLGEALKLVFATPRVYHEKHLLVDPQSYAQFHTLGAAPSDPSTEGRRVDEGNEVGSGRFLCNDPKQTTSAAKEVPTLPPPAA